MVVAYMIVLLVISVQCKALMSERAALGHEIEM